MTTGVSHLSFTFSMIAVVAHVLGIMLPISMWTFVDFSSLSLGGTVLT